MERSAEPEITTSEIVPLPDKCVFRRQIVDDDRLRKVRQKLEAAFDEPFMLVDVESGELVHSQCNGLNCDWYRKIELLREISRLGQVEIVEDEAPLTLLAIPLQGSGACQSLVAVGVFVTDRVSSEVEIAAAAQAFGVDAERAFHWSQTRRLWHPQVLKQHGALLLENLRQAKQIRQLQDELEDAVNHAEDLHVELDLLHRLTGQLHLSENEVELWQKALAWLKKSIHAQCLVMIKLYSTMDTELSFDDQELEILSEGEVPVREDELRELLRRLGMSALRRPIVLNRSETVLPTWHCPTIRELVCVPVEGSDEPCGWLLALNHSGEAASGFREFGSVEVQLLSSIGTILGIHNSNLGLYRGQSQLFAGAVQALTSAIDAKDPYTAGHSHRVALVAVALAQQLGLNEQQCDTLYLGGLLHDIGKIGVDDQVLRKPGELTAEEFEQIKLHPTLGYQILNGVERLAPVLPIVLHHHEAWDGTGYPSGLAKKAIPRLARILAVADAFDAMSSDRPYRSGMPDERLHTILREGAGQMWDAEVVDAFFQIREEIREIVEQHGDTTSRLLLEAVN